jgi:hypothetical protein
MGQCFVARLATAFSVLARLRPAVVAVAHATL